jgi:hypothetical protein
MIKSKDYDVPLQSWIVEVQEDNGHYFIQLTDEMLAATGWKVDDVLLWEQRAGSAWTLRKKP